jgi:hypothetical protein
VLEIAGDLVAGIFGDVLRCGTREELEARAWQDAALGLPLFGSAEPISVEHRDVVVRNTVLELTAYIPCGDVPGDLHVRQLGNEMIEGLHVSRNDWIRREKISPWIRARLQGIAIGERMWWIPRMSDDYNGECRISVRWVTGENH